jgi:O-antigen biosynthesis protein WbqV
VKIDALARQMIQLSGLTPEIDVPIVYTGLRPGEKLFEELWTPEEKPQPTSNPGIRVARRVNGVHDIDARVDALLAAADAGNMRECWEQLLGLVPDFQGQTREAAEMPPTAAPSGPTAR